MFNISTVLKNIVLLFGIFISSILSAKDFVVITSSRTQINTLTPKIVKELFLKKKSFVSDQEIIPVNLPSNEKLRAIFEEKVLATDRTELSDYWIEQHYQGIAPPLTQKSQAGVKAFVKSVKGAIGYIEKSQMESGLRVLYEF
jgi:ABC-type phosphate transport system substrate-binding protein